MDTGADSGSEGFQVNVNGISLLDLLQIYHLGRHTISLRLGDGVIHLRNGELVHAEVGQLRGEAALQRLLALKGGHLDVEEGAIPKVESFDRPFDAVLLEALARMDESAHGLNHENLEERIASLAPPPKSKRSTEFDRFCREILEQVEQALCVSVIRLNVGVTLAGIASRSSLGDVDAYVLQAAAALFRTDAIAEVEQALNAMTLAPNSEPNSSTRATTHCDEIHLQRGPFLYLGRTLAAHDLGILVITRSSCKIGLGVAQLNSSLRKSEWQDVTAQPEMRQVIEH